MSLSTFFTHNVIVQELQHVEDDYAGETSTWAVLIASYNCRLYKPTGSSFVADDGLKEGIDYKLIGGNVNIVAGNKIIDGTDEYTVVKVYPVYAKTSIHHIEILLKKIK